MAGAPSAPARRPPSAARWWRRCPGGTAGAAPPAAGPTVSLRGLSRSWGSVSQEGYAATRLGSRRSPRAATRSSASRLGRGDRQHGAPAADQPGDQEGTHRRRRGEVEGAHQVAPRRRPGRRRTSGRRGRRRRDRRGSRNSLGHAAARKIGTDTPGEARPRSAPGRGRRGAGMRPPSYVRGPTPLRAVPVRAAIHPHLSLGPLVVSDDRAYSPPTTRRTCPARLTLRPGGSSMSHARSARRRRSAIVAMASVALRHRRPQRWPGQRRHDRRPPRSPPPRRSPRPRARAAARARGSANYDSRTATSARADPQRRGDAEVPRSGGEQAGAVVGPGHVGLARPADRHAPGRLLAAGLPDRAERATGLPRRPRLRARPPRRLRPAQHRPRLPWSGPGSSPTSTRSPTSTGPSEVQGIPVFGNGLRAHVDRRGRLISVQGAPVSGVTGQAPGPRPRPSPEPRRHPGSRARRPRHDGPRRRDAPSACGS